MDKQSALISNRQYQKIFNGQTARELKSNATIQKEEKFHIYLREVAGKLNNSKLGIEEFDDFQSNHLDPSGYQPQDLMSYISIKFHMLAQIFEQESQIQKQVEEESNGIKMELNKQKLITSTIAGEISEKAQYQLTQNAALSTQLQAKENVLKTLASQIQDREDSIVQLNKTLREKMDQYLEMKNKNINLEGELEKAIDDLNFTKNDLKNKEEKGLFNNDSLENRQRDLESLFREKQKLSKAVVQNEKKMKGVMNVTEKKLDENDRHMEEYSKMLQKNSANMKRITEIEKAKSELELEIENKVEELSHVRNLNQNCEDKASKTLQFEKRLEAEEKVNNQLKAENEHLMRQLLEIAPHLVENKESGEDEEYQQQNQEEIQPEIILTGRSKSAKSLGSNRNKSPSPKNFTAQDIMSNVEVEKYLEMSLDEMENQIGGLYDEVKNNNDQINALEYENNLKIEEIGGLKETLLAIKSEYMEKLAFFNQIKMDREDVLLKIDQLEYEITNLLTRFDVLSDLLAEGQGDQGEDVDDDDDIERANDDQQNYEGEDDDQFNSGGSQEEYNRSNQLNQQYKKAQFSGVPSPDQQNIEEATQEEEDEDEQDQKEPRSQSRNKRYGHHGSKHHHKKGYSGGRDDEDDDYRFSGAKKLSFAGTEKLGEDWSVPHPSKLSVTPSRRITAGQQDEEEQEVITTLDVKKKSRKTKSLV